MAGGDYWRVIAEPTVLDRGRLVHAYRLVAMRDRGGPDQAPLTAPHPACYADEVMDGVRREWDELNQGFAWLTSLLPAELQARAFDHRGGPSAARRATLWSAGGEALAALYALSFLPGPPGDPVGPVLGVLAVLLLADAARRLAARRRGRYAPSLLRFLLPTDILRPERVAYHAHRDAERRVLDGFARSA
jgi:hypothetical protein